jgi:hypothetical protein
VDEGFGAIVDSPAEADGLAVFFSYQKHRRPAYAYALHSLRALGLRIAVLQVGLEDSNE